MPKSPPKPTESLAEWIKATNAPRRRCRVCKEPGKAELVRELIAAMRRASVRVSYGEVGRKLTKDLGGASLSANTIRNHLMDHEPSWPALLKALDAK